MPASDVEDFHLSDDSDGYQPQAKKAKTANGTNGAAAKKAPSAAKKTAAAPKGKPKAPLQGRKSNEADSDHHPDPDFSVSLIDAVEGGQHGGSGGAAAEASSSSVPKAGPATNKSASETYQKVRRT